jgi:uncharacterized protein YdeI (YjbR/CyaY-like superfamily)
MTDSVLFETSDDFETWLDQNGKSAPDIWLRLAKKAAARQTLTYAQALDVALCHGWIDGVKKALDETHFLQRFTPRKAESLWSKINCEKVGALQQAGRMREAGMAAVALAKANGAWDRAYSGSASITLPDDFSLALQANVAAEKFFAGLDRQNRYAFLYRIGSVKKSETRARKIARYVAMLAKGEKLHP